jgi:shikimate dehydrogenase
MIREQGIQGASVTIPFKETVMALLDECDETARAIGAVNTIVRRNGKLTGSNTDAPGLVRDLAEWMDLREKTFVVLGAGGAACAAVYGLREAGAMPVVVNRTLEKARRLADRFGCRWAPLADIGSLEGDCLVNTTPLGMVPETERTPLDEKFLVHFPRVLDIIYNPLKTRLLREAERAGCAIRSGVGMFVHQGAEQIRLWTGLEAPREFMRQAVLKRLESHG